MYGIARQRASGARHAAMSFDLRCSVGVRDAFRSLIHLLAGSMPCWLPGKGERTSTEWVPRDCSCIGSIYRAYARGARDPNAAETYRQLADSCETLARINASLTAFSAMVAEIEARGRAIRRTPHGLGGQVTGVATAHGLKGIAAVDGGEVIAVIP